MSENPTQGTEDLTIVAPATSQVWPDLLECWRYRHLIVLMALRDIRARYKQSFLGPIWIVLQPLMTMLIFTVIFGLIAKLPTGGKPYAVFAFVALLPWNLFANIASASASCLVSNRGIIEKVYFPRLALPLANILSQLIDFAANLLILAGMLVYYKQTPSFAAMAWIPLYLLLCVALGLGFGLLFSGVAARYRDALQVVTYMTRFWMYATPVVYSIDAVPARFRPILEMNPMTHVVEAFRAAFLGEKAAIAPANIWIGVGICAVVLLLGLRLFHTSSVKVVDIA